ncbi:hypothetical protein LTS18_008626, partial [Coniosporium uncinatum]
MAPVYQRSDSIASDKKGHFEASSSQINLPKSTSPLPCRAGDTQHPLLQSTMDEVARGSEAASLDKMPSLTSASTASPTAEEVHTTIDMANNSNVVASPMQSPIAS